MESREGRKTGIVEDLEFYTQRILDLEGSLQRESSENMVCGFQDEA